MKILKWITIVIAGIIALLSALSAILGFYVNSIAPERDTFYFKNALPFMFYFVFTCIGLGLFIKRYMLWCFVSFVISFMTAVSSAYFINIVHIYYSLPFVLVMCLSSIQLKKRVV